MADFRQILELSAFSLAWASELAWELVLHYSERSLLRASFQLALREVLWLLFFYYFSTFISIKY